jgi:hypothetical protein
VLVVVYYFTIPPFISKKIILVYSLIFIPAAIFWHSGRDRLIFIIGAVINGRIAMIWETESEVRKSLPSFNFFILGASGWHFPIDPRVYPAYTYFPIVLIISPCERPYWENTLGP